METFLSTAFRYLKGESGLPSVLPAKSSLDVAKKDCPRQVRLFCEGLEKFREILYVEGGSSAVLDDHVAATPMTAGTAAVVEEGQVEAAIEKDQDRHDAVHAATEVPISADTAPDQEKPSSTKATTEIETDQKARKYVLIPDQDLFQSSYGTKSPPASPGSASTSSTLVDPSSRKVSPSDSMSGTNASPTAVRDFAYSSSASDHVRDSMSVVGENAKLGLMRQLKTVRKEEKLSRRVENQNARNQVLSAELLAVKAQLRNTEARADLATTQLNAMNLSNFVLRHTMQDLKLEPSHEQHKAQMKGTQSADETIGTQQNEGLIQDHVGSAEHSGASAYDRMQSLENTSDESGDGLQGRARTQQHELSSMDEEERRGRIEKEELSATEAGSGHGSTQEEESAVLDQGDGHSRNEAHGHGSIQQDELPPMGEENGGGRIQQDTLSPMGETVESKTFDSVALEAPDRQATDKEQAEMIGLKGLNSGSEDVQADAHAGESQVEPKQKVDDLFSISGADTTTISGIVESLTPTVHQGLEEKDAEVRSYMPEDVKQVTAHGMNATMGGRGKLAPQEDQDRGPDTNTASRSDEETEKANDSDIQSEEQIEIASFPLEEVTPLSQAKVNHLLPSLQTESRTPVNNHTMGPPKQNRSSEFSSEDPISEANDNGSPPTAEQTTPEGNQTQGTCNSHRTFEFSEAAGPATLWGILQSSLYENEEQSQEDAHAVEVATVSEAAGPATLWGILRSDRCESDGDNQKDAHQTAADISVLAAGTPVGTIRPFGLPVVPPQASLAPIPFAGITHGDNGVTKKEDDADDNEELPRAPNNTPNVGEEMDVEDATSEAIPVSEPSNERTVPTGVHTPNDVTNGVNGDADDKPVAEGPKVKDENGRPEASAVLARASPEEGGAKSGDSDAYAPIPYSGARDLTQSRVQDRPLSQKYNTNQEDIMELDGETVEAPAVTASLAIIYDDAGQKVDHPTFDDELIEGSSDSLATGGDVASDQINASSHPSSDSALSSPLPMSPFHIEKFDFIPPMNGPSELTKGQKRKLERKRAAKKKAEAAERQRRMDEEAAARPEVRAQRQAEEDAKFGEKRLKLQAARMDAWCMKGEGSGR